MSRVFLILFLQSIIFSAFAQNKWLYKDTLHYYNVVVDSVLLGDKYSPTVKAIEIFDLKKNKIQTVTPGQFVFDAYIDSGAVFVLEDMNFDGYNDFRLLNWISTNLQKGYWYWFYDTTTRQFLADTLLEEMWNPFFDPVQKTIHAWWRVGFTNYGHALYKWHEGKLLLLVREEETWDINTDNPGHIILTRMINGIEVEKEKIVKKHSIDFMHDKCHLN
jgi:hypothetical protein